MATPSRRFIDQNAWFSCSVPQQVQSVWKDGGGLIVTTPVANCCCFVNKKVDDINNIITMIKRMKDVHGDAILISDMYLEDTQKENRTLPMGRYMLPISTLRHKVQEEEEPEPDTRQIESTPLMETNTLAAHKDTYKDTQAVTANIQDQQPVLDGLFFDVDGTKIFINQVPYVRNVSSNDLNIELITIGEDGFKVCNKS